MNRISLLLLALLPLSAHAQRGFVCISGDCRDGEGEAFLEKSVYYKGDFRKGRPEGNGYYVNRECARTGRFKAGQKDGYGIEFTSFRDIDGLYYPDSSRGATIGNWAMGKLVGGILIAPDGSESYFSTRGFVKGIRPKDPWLTAQADAYHAARRKGQ